MIFSGSWGRVADNIKVLVNTRRNAVGRVWRMGVRGGLTCWTFSAEKRDR